MAESKSQPTISDRVRKEGTWLGESRRWTRAATELAELKSKVGKDQRLVAVYGGGPLGYSASPLDGDDGLQTLEIIRRSVKKRGMSCSYYAVPAALIKENKN